MFTYEQREDRPMNFEESASPRNIESVEIGNKAVFIHDFHGNYEGILVIGIFNKAIRTYEKFMSSVELQLKDHKLKDKLDLYEFVPLEEK